jgi:four helix bundle protein
MTSEDLKKRTKEFAHRCIKLTESLPDTFLGRHIGGQLIRSSTSVPANYRAACVAISKKSFVAKLSISIEEADESLFWLEFIMQEKLITPSRVEPLRNEAAEITSIFIASRKTAQLKAKQAKVQVPKVTSIDNKS